MLPYFSVLICELILQQNCLRSPEIVQIQTSSPAPEHTLTNAYFDNIKTWRTCHHHVCSWDEFCSVVKRVVVWPPACPLSFICLQNFQIIKSCKHNFHEARCESVVKILVFNLQFVVLVKVFNWTRWHISSVKQQDLYSQMQKMSSLLANWMLI